MKKINWLCFVIVMISIPVANVAAEDWSDYRVYQWEESRARFGIGADYFNIGAQQDAAPAVLLRYRISPEPALKAIEPPWHLGPLPLNMWLEAGSILPHTGKSLRIVRNDFNVVTSDNIDTKLKWQGHLAVGSEIPLGSQRWVVPDAAFGVALASIDKEFNSESSSGFVDGDDEHTGISPYIRFGLNFFPDHVVSFRISFAHVRYSNTFSHNFNYPGFPQDSHSVNDDLSLSGWQIMPMIEVKLLWPTAVHVPVIPQALPPWLLPSYTTEAVSPWVAPPEVAKDPRYKRPGLASVGNVMFQYKNRWVDKVELIGDFNDWTPEPMIKDRSGIWIIVKDLPPGQFHYTYLLNGKKEILDPWNKVVDSETRANGSSVVAVKER